MQSFLRWLASLFSSRPPSLLDLSDGELFARLMVIAEERNRNKVCRIDFAQDTSMRPDSAYSVEIVQGTGFLRQRPVVLCFPRVKKERDRVLRIGSRTDVHRLQPEVQRRINDSSDTGVKLLVYLEYLDKLYICENCTSQLDVRWADRFGTSLGVAQAFTYYEEGCLMIQELDGCSSVEATFLFQPPGQVISSDAYMMPRKPVVYRPVGHRFTSQTRPGQPPARRPDVMRREDAVEGVKSMTRTEQTKMARRAGGVINSSSDEEDEDIYRQGLADTVYGSSSTSSSGEEEEEEEESLLVVEEPSEWSTSLDPSGSRIHPHTGEQVIPMVQMNGKGEVVAYDTKAHAVLTDSGVSLHGRKPDGFQEEGEDDTGDTDIFALSSD